MIPAVHQLHHAAIREAVIITRAICSSIEDLQRLVDAELPETMKPHDMQADVEGMFQLRKHFAQLWKEVE